jgi:hypothetical protein
MGFDRVIDRPTAGAATPPRAERRLAELGGDLGRTAYSPVLPRV